MNITVTQQDYYSIPVCFLSLNGKQFFIGREIGRCLGYAGGGNKLCRNIQARWTKDFVPDADYTFLAGEMLKRVRGLIPRLRRTRKVMLLTRSGIDKVLARSSFDIAFPLKDFLVGCNLRDAQARVRNTGLGNLLDCAIKVETPVVPQPTEDDFATMTQASPNKTKNPSTHELVIRDIESRKKLGKKRYGTILQGGNGRDFLIDTYQELLDACAYVRGELFERYGR